MVGCSHGCAGVSKLSAATLRVAPRLATFCALFVPFGLDAGVKAAVPAGADYYDDTDGLMSGSIQEIFSADLQAARSRRSRCSSRCTSNPRRCCKIENCCDSNCRCETCCDGGFCVEDGNCHGEDNPAGSICVNNVCVRNCWRRAGCLLG